MSLNLELQGKLDILANVNSLTATLTGPGGHGATLSLNVVPPASGDQVGAATSGLAGLNSDGIAALAEQIAAQALTSLSSLIPGLPALDGIKATLDLIEQALAGNLAADLSALVDQLGDELDGSREGGSFGVYLRIAKLLGDAPPTQTLSALLKAILGSAGVTIPPAVTQVGEILPSADSLIRALGGLMALESVLSESERLTGIMRAQLDAPAALREFSALAASFDPALVARIAATDPANAAAVEALATTLAIPADRLDALRERLAAAMGLGEATFAYLDVEQVQSEVTIAATMLRGIDLDPLRRLLANALAGLDLNRLDIGNAPAQSLSGLLTALEAQVAGIAAQITSWDAAGLAQPVTQGITSLTAPLTQLDHLIGQINLAVRGALEAVRKVVVDLPLKGLIDLIHTVLDPVTAALGAITALVQTIKDALDTAAKAAIDALGGIEGTVDQFKAQIEALFGEAKQFIDSLHLEQIAGQIGEKVAAFTQVLQQAQMKPYFDTATSAIGSATDVISKVPFGLLPESMKADVDAAVKPIKDTNVDQAEADIEGALQIGPDGKFKLRGDFEALIKDVQDKYDELIQTLHDHDPVQYLAQIDVELAKLAKQIRELAPQIALQPVQDAIDQVKGALSQFDLRAAIAPLQNVFDQAIDSLKQYSPGQLIDPIEARIAAARTKLKDAIKLDTWSPALDDLSARGTKLLSALDPAQLQPQLEALFGEAQGLVMALPEVKPVFIGSIIAQLLSGNGARIYAQTYPVIQDWINGGGGPAALAERTSRIADAVNATREAVQTLDVNALAGPLVAATAPVKSALTALLAGLAPDSPSRERLQTLLARLDPVPMLSPLAANRDRFLSLLEAAATLGETLRRTGLSEVGSVIDKLKAALGPIFDLIERLKTFARKLGVIDVNQGLVAFVRSVLDSVPPARLARILSPIFEALRGRVLALVNAVLTPVKDGIAQLKQLIDDIDLAPLKAAVDAVFNEILGELNALSPAVALKGPLDAFDLLKTTLTGFDPLKDLLAVLDTLRDTAGRVLEKLSAQKLLATPVAIYAEVVDAFSALDIQKLTAPVLDLLDSIATQVDEGLDETVAAFKGLQAALPSGGGGSSVSVSVSGF